MNDHPEGYPIAEPFPAKLLAVEPIELRNGAGIEYGKLHASTGPPRGKRGPMLHSKHPSSMGRKFIKAGLDWQLDLAMAIKANNRARIKLWLRLLPYLVTTSNKLRVRKWKGKASKAALIALDALEGSPHGSQGK